MITFLCITTLKVLSIKISSHRSVISFCFIWDTPLRYNASYIVVHTISHIYFSMPLESSNCVNDDCITCPEVCCRRSIIFFSTHNLNPSRGSHPPLSLLHAKLINSMLQIVSVTHLPMIFSFTSPLSWLFLPLSVSLIIERLPHFFTKLRERQFVKQYIILLLLPDPFLCWLMILL